MNRLLGILIILLVPAFSWSQTSWRPGEMEAKVYLHTTEDIVKLQNLKLMDEPASQDGVVMAWVYVTPPELKKLEASGLEYVITNADLNAHSQHFWDQAILESYHNYSQLVELSDSLATNFPAICKKIVLSTSPEGRQLAVLKISDNVNVDENEPELMFDGAIHGNEIMGPEILIRYARELCLGYGNDTTYTDLINSREIWLYYLVNPDGFVSGIRYNSNGVDLNRDIGMMWGGEGYSTGPFSQHETKILRGLWLDHNFVLYNNFHGGTEEISLPWSFSGHQPDDWAHINQLASVYSSTSGYSNFSYGQGWNTMYQIFGANKDFNLGSLGQIGWSNEITNLKEPPANQIPMYYSYNVPAMTEMIKRIGWGLEGIVTDSVTGSTVKAAVFIGSYYPVYTEPEVGDYHKYVLPGTYTITVKASGYQTKTITGVTVPAQGSVITNILLAPAPGRYAYRTVITEIPYYANKPTLYADECYFPGIIGPPDSINYSIGRSGYIVIDMGDTIYDGTGDDFKVFEGDVTQEGYYCHVSTTMDGPWTNLGSATGTTAFDLSTGPISGIRYVKITDDGDGQTNVNDAGFDLDGIEILTLPLIADFTASNNTPCMGDGVNFYDETTGNPTGWLWQFPGGTPSTSTEQDPTGIVYATPGIYDVTLTVLNSYTQITLVKEDFINVGGPPTAPTTPSGPTNACQNATTEYTTSGSASATSFIWELTPEGAGTVSGVWVTGTVDWEESFTGMAYLKVKEVTSCGAGPFSDSIAITVKEAPEVLLGPDTLICSWESLSLDAGNPGCSYEWSNGETTRTITVDSSGFGMGIHSIWVNVINSESCMDFDTILVTIDACTGLDDPILSPSIKIYPNPNTGIFYLVVNQIGRGVCEILTTHGKVVYTTLLEKPGEERKLSLPHLRKGIYLLRIRSDNQAIIKKVIIH
ncbi:MAG: T9SS type A sorting domain-containing protein [Bacteroidia bacterium]|nr:T9SS type A sorting domain-containing protein [Bacteroidia bacterium]